jgi:hypothetical protein
MRKNYRNIGKVLGLNDEDRNSKTAEQFKNYENIDADIQHYVYSNVDIKNTIDSLSSSIQKQNIKKNKFDGPQEIEIDLFSTDSNEPQKDNILLPNTNDSNYIQVKKVEYNEKFNEKVNEQIEAFDEENNINNNLTNNIRRGSTKEKPSNYVLI